MPYFMMQLTLQETSGCNGIDSEVKAVSHQRKKRGGVYVLCGLWVMFIGNRSSQTAVPFKLQHINTQLMHAIKYPAHTLSAARR